MASTKETYHTEVPTPARGDSEKCIVNEKSHIDLELIDDDAAQVLTTYAGPKTWDEAEERALRKRIDWKLMPVLCITYGLQYYDKAMLSQAALFGILKDVGLETGNRFSMSAAIFYLGFMVGSYPIMILVQKFPIEKVACLVVVVWGVCLILTPVCTNYQALYTQRFFLGFLESAVSPMFMMIVGSFYKKNEQALRMGIWYSCTGFSAIPSPLINYGWGTMSGTSQWKYMYYFAGALTICWGAVLVWALPPDPVRAKGFSDKERYIMIERLRSNNTGVRNKKIKPNQVIELLLDTKFWLVFFIALLGMVSNGAVSTYSSVVIRGFGYSTLNSLLLGAPSGAWGGGLTIALTWVAYKWSHKNLRCYMITASNLIIVMSAIMLWQMRAPKDRIGMLFAVYFMPSLAAAYGLLMGMMLANTAGYTKRTLASSALYIGYCIGNFIGPQVFLTKERPRYATGFVTIMICNAVAGGLALVYRMVCQWDNRRRDRVGSESFEHALEDATDKENQTFRYIM